MFVDSHCHIDFPELREKLPDVLDAMRANAVTHALCISVNLTDWPHVTAIADAHPNVYATVGVHPDYEDTPEPTVEELVELSRRDKVVGIGETGLDYYRMEQFTDQTMGWQRERFRRHIVAARATGKPLVIHTRAAAEDTLRMMDEEGAGEPGGVMHCFTETWETARACLDLGFHISFSGIVTFRNARDLHEVARRVPLDRMLIETDSPYLAPVPFRGKMNQPAYVKHVAEGIAALRGIAVDEVAAKTSENFFRLFRITEHATA
ncbi:MAG: TatD family hydrolase [Betaproteobacteria bacterium]